MNKSKDTIFTSAGIGKRIKILRGSSSQQTFADVIGVHRNTIMRYEDEIGPPDANVLAKICNTFNVNASWLLLGTGLQYQGAIPIENTHVTTPSLNSITELPRTRPLQITPEFLDRLKTESERQKNKGFLEKAKIAKKRFEDILKGEIPTGHEIEQLASALGVTPVWLAEGDHLPK